MGLLDKYSVGSMGPSTLAVVKWMGLVTAVWVQAISGSNYAFANYSDAIKSLMDLTQLQLSNLSVAKDLGKAFGLIAGFSSDRVPTWAILLIGGIEGLVGYGAQWLVVSQTVKPFAYWQMCIFMCMGGNSTTWMNTAVLVICLRNFRRNRGPVSGILKSYVGLSTAIYTDLCAALFDSNSADFLVMLTLVPLVFCAIAAVFLHEVPPVTNAEEEEAELKYFTAFNSLAVVVAVYLLIYDFIPDPSTGLSRGFSAILLILLASPVAIPVYAFFKSRRSGRLANGLGVEDQAEAPLLASEEYPGAEETDEAEVVAVEAVVVVKRKPAIGEEHTIFESMCTVDFWIMILSFLCGVGTGLAVQNNMGQMGLALGFTDVSIFVSLISIWGFFGRLASGMGSEYLIKKGGTPRPLWNAASQILMAAGYVIMAFALPGALYIGSVIVGMCYGVRLAITVPTASELFGLKYYGLMYNLLILNLPIGSFIFSSLIAGNLYDAEATTTAGGGNTCVGKHCYFLTFLIFAGASLVGFGLDMLLTFRTKNVYTKIFESKKSKDLGSASNGR